MTEERFSELLLKQLAKRNEQPAGLVWLGFAAGVIVGSLLTLGVLY